MTEFARPADLVREQRAAVRLAPGLFLTPAAPKVRPTTELPLFDMHPRVYAVLGAMAFWFLAMMTLSFSSGYGMPVLLAICAVTFGACGLLPAFMDSRWPGGHRTETWAQFMKKGIATASGHLGGGAALAQILVLPGLLALWATFILVLKLVAL